MDDDDNRRGVEREINELRGQLARSVGAISEIDEMRRAVEKSERQRAQLSDHIEVRTCLDSIVLLNTQEIAHFEIWTLYTIRLSACNFTGSAHLARARSITLP